MNDTKPAAIQPATQLPLSNGHALLVWTIYTEGGNATAEVVHVYRKARGTDAGAVLFCGTYSIVTRRAAIDEGIRQASKLGLKRETKRYTVYAKTHIEAIEAFESTHRDMIVSDCEQVPETVLERYPEWIITA
jgi:hypothetical protein